MSPAGAGTRRASSVSSTELARQRDLNKYYQPWLDSKKLKTVPDNVGSDEAPTARCSHDTTLTALAQLAALRLNVKRGMISLIDSSSQIILAEATQTLSLVDERRHAPEDHLWLGNVSLPRDDCMDQEVFGVTATFKDAEGRDVHFPALIVNDTLEDVRFKYRRYVTSNPGVRFYAGVPITTKQGHAIGVYAVSDMKPRPQGLTLDEVQFMEDVAQIVTNHLERVMDTVGRLSERGFMRGISYFLEDLSEYKYQLSNGDRAQESSKANHNPDVPPVDPQLPPARGRSSPPRSATATASNYVSPTRVTFTDGKEDPNQGPQHSTGSNAKNKEKSDSSKGNIRRIFTQASQLLCQQARATGCAFADAGSGLFNGQSEGVVSPPTSAHANIAVDDNFESTEDEGKRADKAVFGDRLDEMADLLSMSVENGDDEKSCQGIVKRKGLKKLILRYPFGKCFYLSKGRAEPDNGFVTDEVVAGGGSGHAIKMSLDLEDQSHILLPRELLSYLSGAKWLMFLPLFNYAQGQWFAAGFLWGNDFSMGDPDDALPYFKTFGSCMMSEVASMEVLNTNIAKSTFIASISHDLRSPLHGMLGSLEFLEDTMTSAYQMSLVGAIETCGKTLLDTIDHLLDYAKINNLNRASLKLDSTKERKTWRDSRDVTTEPMSTKFDLALLTEEVVEAVFVGQTFRKMNLRHHDPVDEASEQIKSMAIDDSSTTEEQIHAGSIKFSGRVFLLLHIQKLQSWWLEGQTGGLRRVIMNVVGNAIKYCEEGCIDISLKAKPITPSEVEIEFSVKDTGIGMSENFINNHLFQAFSQENSFTPGTGLGLSITSQIVKNMRGKIKVDSEKGVGTQVSITMPMKIADGDRNIGIQEDLSRETIKVTTGKTVCILDPLLGSDNYISGELSKLESSIATFCRDWFDMKVIQSKTIETDPDTAVFIYAEPPPIEHLVQQHFERRSKGISGKEAALLVICTNAFEAAALRAAGIKDLVSLGRVIEVISQPVGARKLGKVLLRCLQRVEASELHFRDSSPTSSKSPGRATEAGWNSLPIIYDQAEKRYRPSLEILRWKSEQLRLKTPFDKKEVTRLLPIPSGQPSSSTTASHLRDRSSDRGKRIPRVLLVDDNSINLKLLVTFMTKIKLPHAEAMNGLEAVNKFKEAEKPFDFVLMDLQMPVMDGLEATRQIREFEKERGTLYVKPSTIIAITGVGNEDTRKEAMEAGMSQFLTKPLKFKVLQSLLLEEQEL
ncbi:uncharacterized protein GGS25DRAFT_78789 [Hypoxylon fragiforme]|uniref:uncharacterized protein n=1 Tax=Hypoxylon fragiforme TaxID=63214 RepID=UPI0020C67878|nr:uncharacterized protein GGS25DRAFT_78789 [Hypoxylon fragiforme]KAI2603044.1 hypothetical protein GGS25DRAFT_78789 [Hypoxylon fragiforme]